MKLLVTIPAFKGDKRVEEIIRQSASASFEQELVRRARVALAEIVVITDSRSSHSFPLSGAFGDRVRIVKMDPRDTYTETLAEIWLESDADFIGLFDGSGDWNAVTLGTLCERAEANAADAAIALQVRGAGLGTVTKPAGRRDVAALRDLVVGARRSRRPGTVGIVRLQWAEKLGLRSGNLNAGRISRDALDGRARVVRVGYLPPELPYDLQLDTASPAPDSELGRLLDRIFRRSAPGHADKKL